MNGLQTKVTSKNTRQTFITFSPNWFEMTKKQSLILVGGGGHCKSCIDVIEMEGKYTIAGILDTADKIGDSVCGYNIIGTDKDIVKFVNKENKFLITVGQLRNSELRIKLYKLITDAGGTLAKIISPLAHVSKHAIVGSGTIVMHFALVNADAVVGVNCIVNNKTLIEHDATVADHCHIATGAIINGGVQLGEGSFVGSGTVTKQYIRIPENSFIKANSLIK